MCCPHIRIPACILHPRNPRGSLALWRAGRNQLRAGDETRFVWVSCAARTSNQAGSDNTRLRGVLASLNSSRTATQRVQKLLKQLSEQMFSFNSDQVPVWGCVGNSFHPPGMLTRVPFRRTQGKRADPLQGRRVAEHGSLSNLATGRWDRPATGHSAPLCFFSSSRGELVEQLPQLCARIF